MQTIHLLGGGEGGIFIHSIMVISTTIGHIVERGCYVQSIKWTQIKLKQCQVEVDSLS